MVNVPILGAPWLATTASSVGNIQFPLLSSISRAAEKLALRGQHAATRPPQGCQFTASRHQEDAHIESVVEADLAIGDEEEEDTPAAKPVETRHRSPQGNRLSFLFLEGFLRRGGSRKPS